MDNLKKRTGTGSSSPLTAEAAAYQGATSPPLQPPPAPAILPTVLLAVAVASCGAFSFGYHLGVVNGPLEAIAADLGFSGNAALQGLVRRLPLSRLLFFSSLWGRGGLGRGVATEVAGGPGRGRL